MNENIVTLQNLQKALRAVGLQEGDICLFHSSLKSFGTVEGGAPTVIAAMESIIGKEGTLVAPTLCQVDFGNSYKTWYMDKPSDVGYLTEYFRKQPFVYRSNQATHSVAARGKDAYELTWEHSLRGPRPSPFGDYAFSDGSPWRKMYDKNAKVLFLGVPMRKFTMKHMVEDWYMQWLIEQIDDPQKRRQAVADIKIWGSTGTMWPYYQGDLMHETLDAAGLVRSTTCGNATILCVEAKPTCDATLEILKTNPKPYMKDTAIEWLDRMLPGKYE